MMNLKTEIRPLDDHLLVLATGEYNLDEALDGFALVLAACKLSEVTRVVVDFRCMNGIPHATEKVVYALGAAQHYEDYLKTGGLTLRIAFLGPQTALDSYEPGLDIGQQRNLPIRLFTSEKNAYGWLKIGIPAEAVDAPLC